MNSTTADIGLKDFYAIHILTYCEGNFKSGGEGGLNVTSCSKRKAPFAFDPTKVFSAGFKAGFNISDINWPDSINDDFHVMEITTKAMSVLYIIGVAASGVAFLMEIFLAQVGGKPSMFAHLFFIVVCYPPRVAWHSLKSNIWSVAQLCLSRSVISCSVSNRYSVCPSHQPTWSRLRNSRTRWENFRWYDMVCRGTLVPRNSYQCCHTTGLRRLCHLREGNRGCVDNQSRTGLCLYMYMFDSS